MILVNCNIDLSSLINLELKRNNISNIEPLIKSKFRNLEKLNLKLNKIDNNNIKYIHKFDFPNLKELNLYQNLFTDFELFKSIEHFTQLNMLNVGCNKFEKDTFKNQKFNLNSINEIKLYNGVFNDNSIDILKYFELKNIEIIDLSSNNLSFLSFVQDVNWPKLNRLYLSNNDIKDKDIINLDKFKNLKYIEIYDNEINDIDKVKKLIEKIPKLKVNLNLYSNDNINQNNNALPNNNISTKSE